MVEQLIKLARNTLYDVPWQAVRAGLLGKWRDPVTVRQSLDKLSIYLDDRTNRSRLFRVLNLLNATMMGLNGMGMADSESMALVRAYRDVISEEYAALKASGLEFDYVTDQDVVREWLKLDRPTRVKIYNNLAVRLANHRDSPNRVDLRWFLELVGGIPT